MFFRWSPCCSTLISCTQIWVCTGGTWRPPRRLSLLIWDLEVWGTSPSWEAGSAVKMEPPSKQIMRTLLFLLSFGRAKKLWGGLRINNPINFYPSCQAVSWQILWQSCWCRFCSILKKEKVIIGGLKFHRSDLYLVYCCWACWPNKLGSLCKYFFANMPPPPQKEGMEMGLSGHLSSQSRESFTKDITAWMAGQKRWSELLRRLFGGEGSGNQMIIAHASGWAVEGVAISHVVCRYSDWM